MARSGKGRGSRPAREPRRTVAEAKVFMTGRSQAVRLPKEYRVSGDSVYVKRVGNTILLVPKTGDRWAGLFAALDEFPRDFTLSAINSNSRVPVSKACSIGTGNNADVYLLDTTVWIDLLRSNSRSIRHRLTAHSKSTIGLSIITLCELQYGLEKRAAQYPHLRAREQQLLSAIVAPFDVFLLDHDVVEVYGRVRAALENSGTAIGALDAFIAAQALSLGAVLVTSNEKEFQRVQGLQVENWG